MKLNRYLLLIIFFITTLQCQSQFILSNKGDTADSSAFFEVRSTERGWLIPRMTTAQREAIQNPAAGLMIYNTDTRSIEYFNPSGWVNVNAVASGNLPCGVLTLYHDGIKYGTVEYKGRCWLDRNLGAAKVADSINDAQSYGYYYQWGRGSDGHQDGDSDTTWTLASSPAPGHGDYILNMSATRDWLTTPQSDLWKDSSNYLNNPCPEGWKVPSLGEWVEASRDWETLYDALASPLKIPGPGARLYYSGTMSGTGTLGHYWTSQNYTHRSFAQALTRTYRSLRGDQYRAMGNSVRCIRVEDESHTTFAKLYGGPSKDIPEAITLGADGDFVLSGHTQSFDVDATDYLLMKVDSNGALQWAKTYGYYYYDSSHNVRSTFDGGYLVNGTAGWGNEYHDQMYVLKLDTSGDTLWDISFGGSGYELGYDMVQDPDSGFLFLGATDTWGAGGYDVWVTRADPDGNPGIGYTIGTEYDDRGLTMIRDVDGGYVIAGNQCCSGGLGGRDGKIMKIRIDNTIHVAFSYLFGGAADDGANDLVLSHDSCYVIAGYTESYGQGGQDMYIRKKDSTTGVTWSYTYGGTGTDVAESIVRTADNGFAVLGYTNSFGHGGYDMMLLKLDADGLCQWAYTFGFIGNEYGTSLAQDDNGYLYATGYIAYTSYLNQSPDFLLVKFAPDGSSCIGEYVSLAGDSSPGGQKMSGEKVPADELVIRAIRGDEIKNKEKVYATPLEKARGNLSTRATVTPLETTICR